MLTDIREKEAERVASDLLVRCKGDALKLALGIKPRGIRSLLRRNCKELETRSVNISGDLKFLGGFLKVKGSDALAFPNSLVKGRQVASILLSTMLKGIYPTEYDSQGDLIWKSIQLRTRRAMEILDEIGLGDEYTYLAEEAAIRSTKIWPLLAIMTSEDVTEGYVHFLGPLYLDHVEYGRFAVKNYVLDEIDLEKLVTLIEADINAGLDIRSPLSEVDLILGNFHFRIALDMPPASLGAADIRNLSSMSKLSLPRLISLGTIDSYEAATILDRLNSGDPVLIFGRTGVGKTTLSNSILASLPRYLRIVSVEEVREIEDLTKYGMHHTPYEVTSSKYDFVRFLLHRNPDLVFLGEVLGKEQAEALDMTSFSGLRVLATTHAKDFSGLVFKWSSWGLTLPEKTLAVRMEYRKVAEIRYWVDGSWYDPPSPSTVWLSYIRELEGAYTNEEVSRRASELPYQG